MSLDRVSLLTNVTLCPTEMVTVDGFTPADVIVTVAPLGPVLPVVPEMTVTLPDGEGDRVVSARPPPHAAVMGNMPSATTRNHIGGGDRRTLGMIRRTSVRC